MTKKDWIIRELHEHISFVDRNTIKAIFEVINRKDWAVYCSQMGDFDHPMERVEAEKKCEAELDEMINFFGTYSRSVHEAIELVKHQLGDCGEIRTFYNSNFHKLNEEME